MSSKLILSITIAVTSQDPPDSKYWIDPDEVMASDVIIVECPLGIDAKALDISKVIQGTLPGVIEAHMERRAMERERLRAAVQPSLLTMHTFVSDDEFAAAGNPGEEPAAIPQD
jgi:hypothetical protein